jgi:hypothetical protein
MTSTVDTDRFPEWEPPCDHKWYTRLAVTELLISALEDLKLSWPPPNFDVEGERRRLARA